MPISLEMSSFDEISLASHGIHMVAPTRALPQSPPSKSCYESIKKKVFRFVQSAFPSGGNLEITLGVPTRLVMLALVVFYSSSLYFEIEMEDLFIDYHHLLDVHLKRFLSFVTINLMIISMVFHLPYLLLPMIAYDMFMMLVSILSLLCYSAPVFGYGDSRFYVPPFYFTLFFTSARMLNSCFQIRIFFFLKSYGVKTFSKTG
ncbi:unnamed protein product [Auanema sp. JU1783]|nr:unnamed protein product [Auanema sp. JU1783]